MVDEQIINHVYDVLHQTTLYYQQSSERAIKMRENIEGQRINLLSMGAIDGRNAEAREAQVRHTLKDEYEYLSELEEDERLRKYDLDLARIKVERVRLLMRLQETIQGVRDVQLD